MSPFRPSGGADPSSGVTLGDSKTSLKLLFLVPFGPRFDSKHGGRVTAQLLRRLVDRHEITVVYQRLPGSPRMDPELERCCAGVFEVELSRGEGRRAGLEHRKRVLSSLLGGPPTAVSAVIDQRFVQTARRIALEILPDVIQVEHDVLGYCLPALADAPGAHVLVCHDPGLTAAQDLAAVTSGRRRLASRIDVVAWRRYWSRTLSRADAVVTFTGEDARAVKRVIRSTRVATIPLGIDIPRQPHNPVGAQPPRVIFVGGYVHPPNADAAVRLAQEIMPAVRRQRPGSRLVLVGDQPTQEMFDAAGEHDEITGTVTDVAPFLDLAALLVLPIRLGGGMRVKLLEGLAAGKAVVASPLAVAGLEVTDGQQLRIAETDSEFAQLILELLDDAPARERLAVAARAWAQDHLRWDSCVDRYEQLYQSLQHART
jgi:glycosyltransferase involved in cell wall biosynthesis